MKQDNTKIRIKENILIHKSNMVDVSFENPAEYVKLQVYIMAEKIRERKWFSNRE